MINHTLAQFRSTDFREIVLINGQTLELMRKTYDPTTYFFYTTNINNFVNEASNLTLGKFI